MVSAGFQFWHLKSMVIIHKILGSEWWQMKFFYLYENLLKDLSKVSIENVLFEIVKSESNKNIP